MPPRRTPSVLLLLLVLLLVGLTACGPGTSADEQPPKETIRFASYDFSENEILAAVYAEATRQEGLPVSLHPAAGTREVVEPALEQGVVDVVIDYLGTAVRFLDPGRPGGTTPEQLHAALREVLAPRGIEVLAAAAAEDQNGFAVSRTFAFEHGVSRLSQLEPLAAGLTFGGPPECSDRPLCLIGLSEVYGLRFGEVVNMPSRAATVEALVAGSIQVGLLETTDARLGGKAPVVLLTDDRSLQPHENVVPLVRTAALDRWGDRLAYALDAVSARLTTADLISLNRAVEIEGLTPQAAAARWWDAG